MVDGEPGSDQEGRIPVLMWREHHRMARAELAPVRRNTGKRRARGQREGREDIALPPAVGSPLEQSVIGVHAVAGGLTARG
jgi:hypothetical protein